MSAKERREREKLQRKNEILDAARAILLQKGMAAVSMNQIAKAAELSVGTLYLYFKNKEELFAALQQEGLGILFEMIKKAGARGNDVEEKLMSMADAYLCFSREHRKYFEVMSYFISSPEVVFPDELKEKIDTHGGMILTVVETIFEEAWESSGMAARRDALIFWSTIHGALQLRKLQTTILSGQPFEKVYAQTCEAIIKGLLSK